MPTLAGVGRSTLREPGEAGREAARQACANLGGGAPDLVLLYCTSGYDPAALLAAVRETTGSARLSGCSGEGVIAGVRSHEGDHAVGVMVLRSERLRFETMMVEAYATDPPAAGAALAEQVNRHSADDTLGLFVFPDGLVGDCTSFLGGLDAHLRGGFPVVGGTAGDAMLFQRTYQFVDDRVASGAVAALLVSGLGHMEIGVSHGCTPIGLDRRVTRGEGVWMHEIDGRPAWSVFREYLDGEPESLRGEEIAHLCIGEKLEGEAATEYEGLLIHAPMNLDPATGSLLFPGGGITQGAEIRMTRRDPDRITESARDCARRIAGRHPGKSPAFVMQFDCAGRGRQLFGSATEQHILEPLQRAFGAAVPWIGFHTYGEIAPIAGRTRYHNFTVALCAIYESA